MATKIVIIGAGFAGIKAALTLSKKHKDSDNIEIVVINKNNVHTMITDLHKVAANKVPEHGITVPLRDVFAGSKIKLVLDTIDKIDIDNKKLGSKTAEYDYDYLVIAAGSKPNFYNIPGMEENCFPFWFLKDSVKIREHIKKCFQKAVASKDAEEKKTLLTFVIGGGGFTGVEMVGELGIWIKKLCKQHKLTRDAVRLIIVEAQPSILGLMKPGNIKKVADYLTKCQHVEIMANSMISKLNSDSVEFKSGAKVKTKTLIWTAGITAAQIGTTLCADKGRGCRIPVNKYTQSEYKNVYAIGDICAFGEGKDTLPPMVEPAEQMAVITAENILAEIRGTALKAYKPDLHGVMVSAGSYYAVAEIKGMALPVIMAFFLKHVINMYWLFTIAGVKPVVAYIKDEVFTLV